MASTPLLGLALPTDGTTSWGTLVNTSITALLDSAVAGTTTLASDADATLSTTLDAANEARQAVLLCTGSRAAIRTITAPARSKTYVVINATTGGFGVKIVGVGPTTGVTVPNGRAYMVAWNGSDFVITGITTVNLTSDVTGTLPVANGGTGVTTSTGTGNTVLSTSPTLVTPALGTPASGNLANCTFPTLNQNTTGTAGGINNAGSAYIIAATNIFYTASAGGHEFTGDVIFENDVDIQGAATVSSVPIVTTTGTQTLTNKTIQGGAITSGTVQATTSGTSVDFTSIPSWVKRITVMFDQVSTNGTAQLRVRIGPSAGVETSGYLGASQTALSTGVNTQAFTAGFDFYDGGAAGAVRNGVMTLSLLNAATNTWVATATIGQSNEARVVTLGGSKALAGALSIVRVTTVNGTDAFDAGSVNILYE